MNINGHKFNIKESDLKKSEYLLDKYKENKKEIDIKIDGMEHIFYHNLLISLSYIQDENFTIKYVKEYKVDISNLNNIIISFLVSKLLKLEKLSDLLRKKINNYLIVNRNIINKYNDLSDNIFDNIPNYTDFICYN